MRLEQFAMERMQSSALQQSAQGVVAVQVSEGPMEFARHAVGFTAWGTAVRASPGGHKYLKPRVAVPLDDAVTLFDNLDACANRGDTADGLMTRRKRELGL